MLHMHVHYFAFATPFAEELGSRSMCSSVSPDNGPNSPPRERWWHRLEERWNRIQVGRQGSYSVERLESFDHYCKTISPTRVFWVCILTPLLGLLVAVLLECLPLQPPSESWTANWVFWIRVGLTNFAMNYAGFSQIVELVPELNPTIRKRIVIAVAVATANVATFVLGAKVVGFPFPFTWYVGSFFVGAYTPAMLLIVFGRAPFSRVSPCRPNLLRFFHSFRAIVQLVDIYPLYKILYELVPMAYRGLVVIVLPIWRLAAKQFIVRSIRDMEDFIPEIVAMTVDFFGVLFVSVCISTTDSMYLSTLFIAADLGQLLLEYREVRMNANTVFDLFQDLKKTSSSSGSLFKNAGTPNLPAFILAVTRDPKAFHVNSMEGVRLDACYPHRLSTEQSNTLHALQTSRLYDQSPPPLQLRSVQIQRARITATTLVRDNNLSGKRECQELSPVYIASRTDTATSNTAKRLVLQGLQLMFHCEYLILVEYVECIVPLMYVLFKTVLEHLPNVAYYPGGAGHFGSSAVANIFVFATLEIASLLLLHIVLQRKFAFSPLYQLAFVLETQFYLVQAKLVVESIFLLHYELEHYGMDFTFQFKWLHDNK